MEFFPNNEFDNIIIRAERLVNDNLFTVTWVKTDHEQVYVIEESDHGIKVDIEKNVKGWLSDVAIQ